jgi:signal transduction histidine kinase
MNAIKSTREGFPVSSGMIPDGVDRPWSDVVLVVATTLVSIALSAHFQLNEGLYALTRHWEYLQLDELPIGMLVLSICLMWLAWRRFRHASRELGARRIAEARLAELLAENRQLAREHLRIQESERKHLAHELHDQLGQYLNAIKLDAMSISESEGADPKSALNASRAIVRSVDHVYGAVSEMIGRLRPVGLDELGLVAAIEHCVDYWRQRRPDTLYGLSMDGDFEEIDEALALTVYRLIQEGLTNIHKHAGATRVAISLARTRAGAGGAGELRLTVADDGCGMGPRTPTSRFGISGMRERVEMAGGRFSLESALGDGVRFEARFPACGESP